MACQFPTTETRIEPVGVHRDVGSPSWWPSAGEHPATETHNIYLKNIQKLELKRIRMSRDSDNNLNLTKYFISGFCRLLISARKNQIRSNCYKNQLQPRSESIERNAWSLIVNCHGEPVTTDVAVPTKRFFSQSTHQPVINLAAQGLRDGDAVG